MQKTKRATQEEMKKFLEKTKMNLQKFGKETSVWIKKGEAELSRLSKLGKLEIDVVNLNMKKDRLFKDIGKRVVERGLAKEINDSAIRDMGSKANAILRESRKKKGQMSKMGKGLLKGNTSKSKKKK